jgi:3',5'-cyclic-AMP phosphodiesterase
MSFFKRLVFLSLIFLFLSLVIGHISLGVKLFHPPGGKTLVNNLPENQTFSFAVISDIHSDYNNLQRTLDRIRTDKIDFMVIVGDLTTLGKMEELIEIKTILDSTGIPYYVIPGNHDLWSIKTQINPFADIFGSDYQSFQKGNVKFILGDNGDGLIGIDQRQKTWLDKELTDCPKIYCLVFMHEPLNNPTSKHIMGEDSILVASQAGLLVKQLVVAQVKQLFAGHIHYLSTYTLDGLKTTTDGAIKANPRFIEVFVHNQPISIEEKQVWINP